MTALLHGAWGTTGGLVALLPNIVGYYQSRDKRGNTYLHYLVRCDLLQNLLPAGCEELVAQFISNGVDPLSANIDGTLVATRSVTYLHCVEQESTRSRLRCIVTRSLSPRR